MLPGEEQEQCVSLPITAMGMRKGFNMIFLIRSEVGVLVISRCSRETQPG